MINLLIDAAIAAVKTIDRAMCAVENVRHQATPRPVADVQPAGAGALPANATSTGGHLTDTSELLMTAAGYLRAFRNSVTHTANGPFLEALDELDADLRDRAAQLAAVGD